MLQIVNRIVSEKTYAHYIWVNCPAIKAVLVYTDIGYQVYTKWVATPELILMVPTHSCVRVDSRVIRGYVRVDSLLLYINYQ